MKRQYFCSKFRMFISLTLVPICIFAFISTFYINMQVKEEARENTRSTTELMAQYLEELTGTLEFYKVSVNSDSRLHLALISALGSSSDETGSSAELVRSMKNLYYAQSTKPYLQSIFITIEGSPYFISGIYRESFSEAADSTWAGDVPDMEDSTAIKVRNIKKNKFDTHTIPVVTVYQQLKYKELMAVNIRQDYFNNWLDSIADYDGQGLFITDSNGQVLFSNKNTDLIPKAASFLENGAPVNSIVDGYFYNAGTFPGIYGFRYQSLIPQKEVFKLSNTILKLTLLAGLLSILLSSVLAYFYTMRDYNQIFQIIELFENAEKGKFEPLTPVKMKNHAYFHIINNIINLFMSQTYLKVQLDAKKYALSTAQLSALQYQLNPHFLFNTLQSIDLEVLKIGRKPTPANHMISALSGLLRYALDDPMKKVTVQEEIQVTKSYIDLQTCRLGEQFQVIWDYRPEVLSMPMFRLMLQPIIENSISHSGLSSPEELKIKIKIRKKEGRLVFSVIDNGLGMSPETLRDLRLRIMDDQVEDSGRHIGLKNICQRVRLSYPDGYMKLWSKKGLGTIVEIGGIAENL